MFSALEDDGDTVWNADNTFAFSTPEGHGVAVSRYAANR